MMDFGQNGPAMEFVRRAVVLAEAKWKRENAGQVDVIASQFSSLFCSS